MAFTPGTVTIHGASGISSVLTITNDSFGLSIASGFASLTAQLASTPASFYTFANGSSFLAVENGLGFTGVNAPSGAVSVVAADGSNLVYSAPLSGPANTAVIIGGSGDDTVSTGAGTDTVALGTGHNGIVIGQSGLVDSAGTDTVIAGLGTTTVNVSGVGTYIGSSEFPGASLIVNDAAGSGTTVFTVSNATITGASAATTTIDGYGPTTVNAGAGGVTYNQSGGTLYLNAFKGETDRISVTGSTGPDTLYGASGSTILFSGSANTIFVANDSAHGGTGSAQSAVFNASSATGNNQFWAGSGNSTLIGGTGSDTLVGGAGASTLTGGSGAANYFDLFSMSGGSGTSVTVTDFGANSSNQINLFGYGSQVTAIQDGLQQSQSPAGTTISLNDGSKIILQGYTGGLSSKNVTGT